jgi:hypothetical protein
VALADGVAGSAYYLEIVHLHAPSDPASAAGASADHVSIAITFPDGFRSRPAAADGTASSAESAGGVWLRYERGAAADGTATGQPLTIDAAGRDVSQGAVVNATVSELAAGQPYRFAVLASNLVGPSPSSAASAVVVTGALRPAPVSRPAVDLESISTSALQVAWVGPYDNGAEVTGYNVSWRDTGEESSGVSTGLSYDTLLGTQRTFTAQGLQPGTLYVFSVAAANEQGYGNHSVDSVAVATSPTVPSAPALPATSAPAAALDTLTNLASASVNVSWVPPRANGLLITSFRVTHRAHVEGATEAELGAFGSPTVVGAASSAVVQDLQPGAAYEFAVEAFNSLGYSAQSAASAVTTMLATVPSAPAAPTTSALVATLDPDTNVALATVLVSWVAPHANGRPVTAYTVLYRVAGDESAEFGSPTLVGSVGSATVVDLTPGTVYQFTVFATNEEGSSPQSPVSVDVEMPSVRPSAPAAPTTSDLVAALNLHTNIAVATVTVAWAVPAANGRAITAFSILRRVRGSGAAFGSATTVGVVTSAPVTGLLPGEEYEFTVAAVNLQGTGPQSPVSDSVEMLSTIPSAPAAPRPWGQALSSIALNWTAPAANGAPVTAYIVRRRDDGVHSGISGFDAATQVVFGGALSAALIVDLFGDTPYEFQIAANNSVGQGPFSNASVVLRTPEAPPEAPEAPHLRSPTSTNLTALWTAPLDNGHAIIRYVIQYQPMPRADGTRDGVASAEVGDDLRVTLTGLQSDTTYEVQVKACSGKGCSLDWSGGSILATLEASPAAGSVVLADGCSVPSTGTCNSCAARPECGWCVSRGACLGGVTAGPFPSLAASCPQGFAGVAATATPGGHGGGYASSAGEATASPWRFFNAECPSGLALSTTRLTLSETGGSQVYAVSLEAEPKAAVTISIVSPSDVTTSASELVFGTDTWAAAQSVTVSAVPDSLDEGTKETHFIKHAASSADPRYSGNASAWLPTASLSVYVYDDDTSAVVITPEAAAVSVVEGTTAPDAYWLALGSQPFYDVTVTVVPAADAAGATVLDVTPASLVFTTADWATARAVNVTARPGTVPQVGRSVLVHSFYCYDCFFSNAFFNCLTYLPTLCAPGHRAAGHVARPESEPLRRVDGHKVQRRRRRVLGPARRQRAGDGAGRLLPRHGANAAGRAVRGGRSCLQRQPGRRGRRRRGRGGRGADLDRRGHGDLQRGADPPADGGSDGDRWLAAAGLAGRRQPQQHRLRPDGVSVLLRLQRRQLQHPRGGGGDRSGRRRLGRRRPASNAALHGSAQLRVQVHLHRGWYASHHHGGQPLRRRDCVARVLAHGGGDRR